MNMVNYIISGTLEAQRRGNPTGFLYVHTKKGDLLSWNLELQYHREM